MIIHATKKMQDFLKLKALDTIEDTGFNHWYGNIFMVGRRKGMLLTHTKTLYSIFIYGVTQATIKDLENVIKHHLKQQLRAERFSPTDIKIMVDSIANIQFTKASDKSVLASMNQMVAFINGFYVGEGEDLLLSHRINHMPVKKLDYTHPIKALKSLPWGDDDSSKSKNTKISSNQSILTLKIQCTNEMFDHKNHKQVEMLADTDLADLCHYILDMFEFDHDHMHRFYLSKNGDPYRKDNIGLTTDDFDLEFDEQLAQEAEITLSQALEMKPEFILCMHFDFGDDWVFKISKYQKQAQFDSSKQYPRVVKSVGKDPQQYPDWE